MDGTVVLALALGLGTLLLWSLLILVEDMAGSSRDRVRRPPAPRHERPRVAPRDREPTPPSVRRGYEYDDRFEQLVDQWFGPESG